MQIKIQKAVYSCDDCSYAHKYSPDQIFLDKTRLEEYTNQENIICITQVEFCIHKIAFSTPGICILGNYINYLFLNKTFFDNSAAIDINYRNDDFISYRFLGKSASSYLHPDANLTRIVNVFKDFDNLNGIIFSVMSSKGDKYNRRIKVKQILQTITENLQDGYTIQSLYLGYYVIIAKPILTKRAIK